MSRRAVDEGSAAAAIIADEEEILARVRGLLSRAPTGGAGPGQDYDADLISLRDQAAEARAEDLPPLVEQMTRIAALAAGQRPGGRAPVDAASPYFAHLRLRERDKARDVLIGRTGLIDRPAGVQIVDWRDAPVSRIYYRYEEGDDYDEALPAGTSPGAGGRAGGTTRRLAGMVEARRNVSIHAGALRRIGCPGGTFVADGERRWWEIPPAAMPALSGGSGKAARPPSAQPPPRPARGKGQAGGSRGSGLGIQGGQPVRQDKHLPEIAALIDRHQFDLIAAPSSGLVVIQGGAGSGKTTVALHRVAFLVFHDPKRFRANRSLVVVPSPALERYVSGVLPALGVRGVPVTTSKGWMRWMRKRVLGPNAVPDRYHDETPSRVARVKKHPALLAVLDQLVRDQTASAAAELGLDEAGAAPPSLKAAWSASAGLPPAARFSALRKAAGREHASAFELAIRRVRRRLTDAVAAWSEVLTDAGRLRAGLPADGPRAVSDGEIAETVKWTSALIEPPADEELAGADPEALAPIDAPFRKRAPRDPDRGDAEDDDPADDAGLDDSERGRAAGRLDVEDDPILLRLAQLLHGGLCPAGHDPVTYDHLALDEAQDLSALEVRVLLDTVVPADGERGPDGKSQPRDRVEDRSVTIAGDVAQRLVLDNYFLGWAELLADVGVRSSVAIRPLHISYRSTEEVMRFARGVLGPLAEAADVDAPARPGAPVVLHRSDAMGEAVALLADALRSLQGREPGASVALIARYPTQADAWYSALRQAELPWLRRVSRQDFAFTPGVDVTDVAQVKGLEFDYVVLLDVTAANYPATVEARHLLHIGATRAAHQLWLTAVGAPSPLCPAELLEELSPEESTPAVSTPAVFTAGLSEEQ